MKWLWIVDRMSSRMLEQSTVFPKYLCVNLSENGLIIFPSCVTTETPSISIMRMPYASIFVAKDAGLNTYKMTAHLSSRCYSCTCSMHVIFLKERLQHKAKSQHKTVSVTKSHYINY